MHDLYLEISLRNRLVSDFDTLIKNKKTGEEELFSPSCCILLNTPAETYFSQPISQATFNLANSTTGLPLGTISLLTLGLKFSLKVPHPTNKINHSINCFETNVQTKYLMRNQRTATSSFHSCTSETPLLSWKCRRRVVSPDPPKRHVVHRHADVS